MNAEIIAVGTELLLGQIVNTNAQYLSQQLAELGINVYHQTVVGDNANRMYEAFKIASSRADLIIITGGIGPTQDDITKETLARFTNKEIIYHGPTLQKIEDWLRERNQPRIESNLRQAHLLTDSDPLFNEIGFAVGVALAHEGKMYIVMPGVPREMKLMFANEAKPWIRSRMTEVTPLFSKILKFCGIGESALEDELKDLISAQKEVTIAPYAQESEIAVRISTKAKDAAEAEQKFSSTIEAILERVGEYKFADDDLTLEHVLIEQLAKMNKTISVAESCTGGTLSNLLTSIPGSSSVFKGGVITYSNEQKHRLLDIPMSMLEGENAPGAISPETAKCMAENVLERCNTDYALSVTGIAGPDPVEGKPVGEVHIGLAIKGQETILRQYQMRFNREMVKLRASKFAMHLLYKTLNGKNA